MSPSMNAMYTNGSTTNNDGSEHDIFLTKYPVTIIIVNVDPTITEQSNLLCLVLSIATITGRHTHPAEIDTTTGKIHFAVKRT